MPFAGEFIVKQLGELWEIQGDLVYYDSEYIPDTVVPAGYFCDGSSIPRFAWPLVGHPLESYFASCGFLHDYCYQNKIYPRRECDQAYMEGLIELGCPEWKAKLCYLALRTFGWWAYKS